MGSQEVRLAAARVQSAGDDVRRLAAGGLGVGSVSWCSSAAAGFRRQVAEELAAVGSVAARLDDAAQALRRHALALDSVLSADIAHPESSGGFGAGGRR